MKEITESWLKFAKRDFMAKELLYETMKWNLFLHFTEQSIEKLLKAILLEHDVVPPKSHN